MNRARLASLAPHAAAFVLLALMLLPKSAMQVAARIGYEMHVVSFLIGPATYAFGDALLPGIDYFTQYSVGFPWVFSWLLEGSADRAVLSYVRLMIGAMFFFYWGLFYLLWWLFSSWRWALVTAIIVLVLQFHVERTFFDPSSYVLRYPLLVATIAAVALWITRDQRAVWGIPVSVALGLSLFLNTETGLYQILTVAFIGFFASRGKWSALLQPAAQIVGGIALFLLLCGMAFGAGAFGRPFLAALLEPFTIYGGGFGGWAIDWRWQWHLLYNIVAPGLALATMAWGAYRLWTAQVEHRVRACIGSLAGFAAAAIMMSAKYSNMSIVALWHVSAVGFLVVLAWWMRQLQLLASQTQFRFVGMQLRVASVIGAVSLIAALLLVSTTNDPRNPTYYGLRAYLQYPSLINPRSYRRGGECRALDCAAPRIHHDDVAMIVRLVPEKQRAAVFGWNDWAYLIEARRASWFHFLPSQAIFTRPQLAAASAMPDLLFLPNRGEPDYGLTHPELASAMLPVLRRDYDVVEKGRDLVAWRRKGAAAIR